MAEFNIFNVYRSDELARLTKTLGTYETKDSGLKRSRLDLISKLEEKKAIDLALNEDIKGLDMRLGLIESEVMVDFYLYASECAKYDDLGPLNKLLVEFGDDYYNQRIGGYYTSSNNCENYLLEVLKQVRK